MYHDGLGVKKDHQKALELYTKSTENGNRIAPYNIGFMYEYGEGVQKNINTAIKWYQMSCERYLQPGCERYERLKKEVQ